LLRQIEEKKLISKSNGYQDILNDIARDLLNKHRRRRQRTKELDSLRSNHKLLEEKAKYMEDQKKSYNDYVSACMSQFNNNKKSKPKRVVPFSKQYFHMKELQKTGNMPQFGSFKYTADQLFKKGVLVSINDVNQKQYEKITMTISSDEPGVFTFEASFLNLQPEKSEIRFEELLQLQYENVSVMSLFDGMAKANVNLLVYLINKKYVLFQ
jgi:Ras GTPase-activating-like protein IQGAP2/3